MEQAKKRIFALKEEVIATTLSLGALALPIKTAIDFESAMADVKKVVDFDSKEEIKAFSSELLKMSQIIPMSAQGLTQVASAGAQMGIAKEELFKFTDLVAKTAVAFDITAEQAGESIGKIKNILALNINETGKMMDAINHLSNKNAPKAGEIVETMKRIAGISSQVGITKEQTAALATTFITLGKAPETASSASEALLKKLNNIGSQSPKARKAFESTGLSIKNFQKLNEFIQKNEHLVKNIGIVIGSLIALKSAFLGAKIASELARFSLGGYRQILQKLPCDCLQLGSSLGSCNMSLKSFSARILRQRRLFGLYAMRAGLFALTTTPAGVFLTAIATIAIVIYKKLLKAKSLFSGFLEAFLQGIAPIFETLKAFAPLSGVFSLISNFFNAFFTN